MEFLKEKKIIALLHHLADIYIKTKKKNVELLSKLVKLSFIIYKVQDSKSYKGKYKLDKLCHK